MPQEKTYKVESKGSLWEVYLSSGCYSDWSIEHYIFAGNSEEEIWEFVKKWASQNGTGDLSNRYIDKRGLTWNDKRFRFTEKSKYGDQELPDTMNWDTDYGDAYKVEIKRAEVIYVN